MLAVGFGAGSQEHADHYLLGTINAVFVTLRRWTVLFLPKKISFSVQCSQPRRSGGPSNSTETPLAGTGAESGSFPSPLPVLFLAEKVAVCLMQSSPGAPLSPSWEDYLRTGLAGGETLLSDVGNSKRKVPTRVAPFLPSPPQHSKPRPSRRRPRASATPSCVCFLLKKKKGQFTSPSQGWESWAGDPPPARRWPRPCPAPPRSPARAALAAGRPPPRPGAGPRGASL